MQPHSSTTTLGSYGSYPLRHYAPPQMPRKPGTSFTIDALLAKDEGPPGITYLPGPIGVSPGSYVYSPVHAPPGYSVYCCPPFAYQTSCRGFYAQASMSKVNPGLHAFKTKGGKSKRMRTSFTSDQLSRLEKEFARQQYMVGSERFLLASALQLTEAQVKVWFQNRRIKWRKQSLEQQQAKLAKLGLAAPPKSPGSQGNEGEEEEEDVEFSDSSDVDVDVSDDFSDHC